MRYLGVVGLIAGTGCVTIPSDTPVPPEFVFEVEHVNFAWGRHWLGVAIDREGGIFAYDHRNDTWADPADGLFKPEQVRAKYAVARHVGRVPPAVLRERIAQATALDAPTVPTRSVCADAGATSFVAWRRDATGGGFRRVTLRLEGDTVLRHDQAAAHELAMWLRGVVLAAQVGVTFFSTACVP